ncbi:MAG: glycogen debranching enzyme N-terminal domain-containing protein [Clostridia bacterium]|nr:glycogen debranching enzyme N-terminal domain-containing protein [Clostridia bacterium]
MKITKENLNLEDGLKKEWLITNGIGGYASSTVIGTNTRRYHGLMIAPLNPPAKRFLILTKVDEAIEIEGQKHDLYTNVGTEYTSQGFKYLESFEKEFVPIFRYKVENIEITKIICFDYGRNTIGIYYKIKTADKPCKLSLAPIVNYRDFHHMNTGHTFDLKQTIKGSNKVRIVIDNNNDSSVYMKLSEGEYTPHFNDTFRNMFYIEEQKRGFYPEENHAVTGVYEVEIDANTEKDISFVCSLEENIDEIDVRKLISREIVRQNELYNDSLLIDNRNTNKTKKEKEEEQFIKDLITATDNFVFYRPIFGLHSLMAGYPWFLDWGRDSSISFEGLLLITKRFDIAREVLMTMVRDTKYGLVPNGYSGFDNRPLYNSADSSLLIFEQVQKYLDYTGDLEFVKKYLYKVMKMVIDHYIEGIDFDDNNIYMDSDNLIVSGTDFTQNTWMDAKFDGYAVTPRNGKAVEINALWYNANKIMQELSLKYGEKEESQKYEDLARACKVSFMEKFYNKKRKCLYDVVGDSKIRPNQLFALSLTYPVIDPQSEEAKNIINVVEKKLLNSYGLKTLAKGEEKYVEMYEGGPQQRDASYHQGITWPWLLGLYYNSLKNMRDYTKTKKTKQEIENKIEKFRLDVKKTFKKEFYETGCIGSIAELYDSVKNPQSKGAFAQAWSVSEVFRIILGK